MRAGEFVDQRFEIEHLAGAGGMGRVFRARDARSGEAVALKLLHGSGSLELARFEREGRALAAMQVPGVVRYVAQGTTSGGEPFLAMEWIEGETLSERLARGMLTLEESLALATRVALTLGRIHRMGVVHRDLKPSNLLLVGGDLQRVTLIDFGVARMSGSSQQLTTPGAVVGTPGYMAPEQARGMLDVDARADVFALGCVLFRCLTGRAPFEGANGLAVLAKVLLEEPPRLRTLVRGISARLEDLVARMLAKAPEQRPEDGEAVAAALAAIQERPSRESVEAASSRACAQELTRNERKVMCLVLALDRGTSADLTALEHVSSQRTTTLHVVAERHDGLLELLDGRLPLIVLTGVGAPTDLAAKAVRCAFDLQRQLDVPPIAVVTGRAEVAAQLPVGELIDRAARMLPARGEPGRAAMRLDDVTAALLGGRFEIAQDEGGFWLLGERDEQDAPPRLLGKVTPYVGRDRELVHLDAELSHCIEEHAAAAVLVSGPAGMGKSRLCREFLRAVRARDERAEIWLGQADPMSAGAAFGLLSSALRRGLGLEVGQPLDERRRKLLARVERHEGLDARRVAAFLGELLGAPFPDDDELLRAARKNPMIMGDQLRLACEELLEAECSVAPVVLVLEDLHYGDLPTVTLVDSALRRLRRLPFLVLALARPDVHERFPKLWDGRSCQEIRLSPLSPRAAATLVRDALGEHTGPELVQRLVERADGNAFYLEELIRAAASGKGDALPETVVAMVHTELESLTQEARLVLRAASVFGESFSQGGVAALLGGAEVAEPLRDLVARELIHRVGKKASGELEYRFRHALVREAAYGMLTDSDRQLGHALAGAFLDGDGGAEPMALAEHFERGGEPARAATAYLRAAKQALLGNDLAAAVSRAERGIACSSAPEMVGPLRLVQASAHRWRGEYALEEQRGIEAIELLDPGSEPWFYAIALVVLATSRLGAIDRCERWIMLARDTAAAPLAQSAQLVCFGTAAYALRLCGRYAVADALIDAMERAEGAPAQGDFKVAAELARVRSLRAMGEGDLAATLLHQRDACAAYERGGDRRAALASQVNCAFFLLQLGDARAAEEALRSALRLSEQLATPALSANILQNLGFSLAVQGRLDEARTTAEAALATYQALGNPRMEGGTRCYLAKILALAGDPEAAEREARAALDILSPAPPMRALSLAVLSRALLDLGRADEALSASREGLELVEKEGAEEGESMVRLVHAEALFACGDSVGGRAAIASARSNLFARAEKLSDPAWRERFLRDVPEHARTLELAERWLGD